MERVIMKKKDRKPLKLRSSKHFSPSSIVMSKRLKIRTENPNCPNITEETNAIIAVTNIINE